MFLSIYTRIGVFVASLVTLFLVISIVLSTIFEVSEPWLWSALLMAILAPVFHMLIFQLPYIKWKIAYEVGVDEIDYDHKQLVSMINQVVSASQYNLGDHMVNEILANLMDYTKNHLAREEKLMEEYEYPGRFGHATQHAKFIEKANVFFDKYSKEKKMKNNEMFRFLHTWLIKHISKTDKELGAYISKRRSAL